MSDFLVDLGTNPFARKLIQQLGLPVPLPVALKRESQPWQARPLAGSRVVLGTAPASALSEVVENAIRSAGAEVVDAESLADGRADALVFDATGIESPGALHALYAFFQPLVTRIARSGRVVLLGRADATSAEAAAAQGALEGFTRSLAKEVGKLGATANLVRVETGAEARLEPVLRFLLSPRSAFVTGQPLRVGTALPALPNVPLVRPLESKVALVTGAARGIGAATARLLAQEGARVLLLDRPADGDVLENLARELGGVAVQADLASADAVTVIAAAVEGAGGLDVVVHNAGITRDKTLARMKPEQWDPVVEVNLAAIARITPALERHLRDNGRILCLSSVAGIAGNFGQTAYAASKSGVIAWVKAEAQRLAPRGIAVNALAPGFIETRLTEAMPFAIREVARRLSALSQGGRPEDVGQAISFLASPGAQGITGQVLRVCGGAFVGA